MFAHVKRSPKTGSQAHFKSLVNSSWSYPGNIVALCVLTSTLGGLRCSGCVPTARCEPLGEAEGSGAWSLDPCLAPKPSSAAQLCGSAGVTLGELPAFPAQASGRLFLQRARLGLPPRAIVPGTHPGPPAETGLTLSFAPGPTNRAAVWSWTVMMLGFVCSPLSLPQSAALACRRWRREVGSQRGRAPAPSAARPICEPQFASPELVPQSPPEEGWGEYRPAHGAVLRPGHRGK